MVERQGLNLRLAKEWQAAGEGQERRGGVVVPERLDQVGDDISVALEKARCDRRR
jgi:hypothetical protein